MTTLISSGTLRDESFRGSLDRRNEFCVVIVPFQTHHRFTVCNEVGYKAGYRNKKVSFTQVAKG